MKSRKGITLVELLLVLALISIIIVGGTNFLLLGVKSHAITIDEFDIQSKTRLVSSKINSVIRDSSGVFVLHREDAENLTDEWNYIMLNEDNTKLLEYAWDGTSKNHVIRELVTGIDDVSFDLEFIKRNASDVDKLLEFNLNVKTGGKERIINTELESINALQVIDRSYLEKGNTLSYRYDSRLDEASNAQAVVSMVLDTSGSMEKRLNNTNANDGSNDSDRHSRLKKMKAEATSLVENLGKNKNIYLSLVPFDSTANNPDEMLQISSNLTSITDDIDDFSAGGGTNTGDGIRRGYFQIADFNEEDENKNKTNKNFMIILVDGVTTFASVNEFNDQFLTPVDYGSEYIISENDYDHEYDLDDIKTRTVRIDDGEFLTYQGQEYSKYSTTERDLTQISGNKRNEPFIQNNTQYFFHHTEDHWWYGTQHYYSSYNYEYRRYIYEYDGVRPDHYVTGDQNIDSNQAQSDTYYSNGRYAGNGGSLDPWGTEYVNIIGDMVKEYKEGTNEAIQVYVIGFSAVSDDHDSLGDISMATRGDDVFYEAGDSEALEEIFKAIQKDITDALWHIGGPN